MAGAKGVVLRAGLLERLEAYSDASLEENRQLWEPEHRMRMSTSTMSSAIHRLGWT